MQLNSSGQLPAVSGANLTNLPTGSSGIIAYPRNAKFSIPSAATSGVFTADEVPVKSYLGGASLTLSNYAQTINLGSTGAGGMDTGTAPTSGFVSLYAIAQSSGAAPSPYVFMPRAAAGNTGTDVSQSQYPLTLNSITTSSSISQQDTYAWVLNGSSSWIDVSNQPSMASTMPGGGNFTMAAWVYPTASETGAFLLGGRNNNSAMLYFTGSYTVALWQGNVGAVVTCSTALTQNAWNHIAWVRNGITSTCYVNGNAAGSATDTNVYQNGVASGTGSGHQFIGGCTGCGFITGSVAAPVMANTALWTANFTPPTTPVSLSAPIPSILATNVTTSSGAVYTGTHMPSGYTYSALLTTVPTNATPAFPILNAVNGKVSYPKVQAYSAQPTTSFASTGLTNSLGQVAPNAISISGIAGSTSSSNAVGAALASDASGTNEIVINLPLTSNAVDGFYAAQTFADLPVNAGSIFLKSTSGSLPLAVAVNSYRIY